MLSWSVLGLFFIGAGSGTDAPRTLEIRGRECTDGLRWEALIRDHTARYEAMQVADMYKLMHQASMGSEHAAPSLAVAGQWLSDELADLPDGPREPLVDPLGEGSGIARIHLRPFVASGGSADHLLEAFVATAAGTYGGRPELKCSIQTALGLAQRDLLPWKASDVNDYLASRAAEGYPAVHHSADYEARYGPAYRVVSVDLVPSALAP